MGLCPKDVLVDTLTADTQFLSNFCEGHILIVLKVQTHLLALGQQLSVVIEKQQRFHHLPTL